MDILTLLFALATFVAVVLFLEGGYLWVRVDATAPRSSG